MADIESHPETSHAVTGQDVDMIDAEDTTGARVQRQDRRPLNPSTPGPIALPSETTTDRPTFIIAVDFGTTFSSVAFVRLNPSVHRSLFSPRDVHCIANYPDIASSGTTASALAFCDSVPTEIWYVSNDSHKEGDGDRGLANRGWESESEDLEDHSDEQSDASGSSESTGASPTKQKPRSLKKTHVVWGYGIQRALIEHRNLGTPVGHLTKFKLMLDNQSDNEDIQSLREALEDKLTGLKDAKMVKKREHIIADYLTQLLQHAKKELVEKYQLLPDSHVEFVLSVPNIWTGHACRVMHDAMAKAVNTVGLGPADEDCIDELFIVSEPEAAAEFVLADSGQDGNIHPDETLMIMDAGGGTVDITTYSVNQRRPLRLKREAVKPGSALCGSSFLNDRYRSLLLTRLRNEADDIAGNGISLESVIEPKVLHWENIVKREIDVLDKSKKPRPLWIHGLKKDRQKGFQQNWLELSRKEIKGIFDPSLNGIERLLEDQLRLAADVELDVSKVILVGGFSASKSLETHIRKVLSKMRSFHGNQIELIAHKRFATSAVAQGAVLRALRKEHGPARFAISSYGFLCTEEHRPDLYPQHEKVRPTFDKIDGYEWVRNTISWVIQKVRSKFKLESSYLTVTTGRIARDKKSI